jgi:hypothetical protein
VSPSLVKAFKSVPCEINHFTTSTLFSAAARCRGVSPFVFGVERSEGEIEKMDCAMDAWPMRAARCMGELPLVSVAFIEDLVPECLSSAYETSIFPPMVSHILSAFLWLPARLLHCRLAQRT